MGRITVKTAGYGGDNDLHCDSLNSECGAITDGIVLSHNNEGCWVIAFNDLERLYVEARDARSVTPTDSGKGE